MEHERPDVGILAAKLDALKDLVEEKDKRYAERHTANQQAVSAALDAAKEAVSAALAAAEKAAEKVEAALGEYKVASNEWRATLNDITNRMPTRQEMDAQITALSEKVGDLMVSRASGGGKEEAVNAAQVVQRWMIGLVVTVILFLVGNFLFGK